MGLHVGSSHSLNGKIGLVVALLENARAVVRNTVAVHVFAVDGGSNFQVIVPGLGRGLAVGFQHILAIVDHLEVAIDHQHLGFATHLLAEFAEIRCDVSRVDFGVLCNVGIEVFEQTSSVKFNAPAGRKHTDVNRIGARGPVGLDLRENFSKWNFTDNDLGARGSAEFHATLGKASGDNIAGACQDVDGNAIIFTGGCRGGDAAKGCTGSQSADQVFVHWYSSRC